MKFKIISPRPTARQNDHVPLTLILLVGVNFHVLFNHIFLHFYKI